MWLLRLMADRGLALLDASTLLMVIEERGELRVAAASGSGSVRLRIMPVQGSALGRALPRGQAGRARSPRGQEAAWLHELGLEARAVLVEPLSMEGQGGGLVIALRSEGGFRGPDRRGAAARSRPASRSVWRRSARSRSNGCATAWRRASASARAGRERSTTRASRASARCACSSPTRATSTTRQALSSAVDAVLEGLGTEIDGLRHLITELRPAALDDLGLAAALEALARRAQAIDGLDVQTEIDLGGR